ncbi:hypothetical protein CL648_03595 [bacterium]|nr:hypothetical protein [bacterium]|tara:strand:- start:289 stop:789 length:501 start_codon:yes stop_codon:yes gene_type:complete
MITGANLNLNRIHTFKKLTGEDLSKVSVTSPNYAILSRDEAKTRIQEMGVNTNQFPEGTNFLPIYNKVCLADNFLKSNRYVNSQTSVEGNFPFEKAVSERKPKNILEGLILLNADLTNSSILYNVYQDSSYLLHVGLKNTAVQMMKDHANNQNVFEFAVKLLELGL